MASYGYTRQYVLGGTSALSSTVTLGPILSADWNNISISISTNAAAASTHTIQGSNDDGFFSSIVTWSNLSVVATPGVVKIDNGPRWMRILKPSVDSFSMYLVEGRAY